MKYCCPEVLSKRVVRLFRLDPGAILELDSPGYPIFYYHFVHFTVGERLGPVSVESPMQSVGQIMVGALSSNISKKRIQCCYH